MDLAVAIPPPGRGWDLNPRLSGYQLHVLPSAPSGLEGEGAAKSNAIGGTLPPGALLSTALSTAESNIELSIFLFCPPPSYLISSFLPRAPSGLEGKSAATSNAVGGALLSGTSSSMAPETAASTFELSILSLLSSSRRRRCRAAKTRPIQYSARHSRRYFSKEGHRRTHATSTYQRWDGCGTNSCLGQGSGSSWRGAGLHHCMIIALVSIAGESYCPRRGFSS